RDGNDLSRDVDALDSCRVPDVDPGLDVGVLGGEEQPLEVVDLLAVYVRDAAWAVGDVLELGEDHNLVARISRLDTTRGADAGGSAYADYDLDSHASNPLRAPSGQTTVHHDKRHF